jgi:hypothetical protein
MELLIKVILHRLKQLLALDISREHTPKDLVGMDMCDPIKLFIKNEPHKLSKIEEGRLRLIFSVSLADNIICRLLCGLQNAAEIEQWEEIPSKPGMGLHDYGLSVIQNNVSDIANLATPAEADISGWDFSVNESDFRMDADRRVELAQGQGTVWSSILKAHFYCMARKVVVLSDGRMFEQLTPGVMPSGWYNTSSSNSAIRGYTHFAICDEQGLTPSIIAAGDDSVERNISNAEQEYLSYGKRVKMFNTVSRDRFSFCSIHFENGTGYPETVAKQLLNLLCYKWKDSEDCYSRLCDFRREMRNHPQLDFLNEIIKNSGWMFSSRELHSIGSHSVIDQNCYFSANQNAKRLHGSSDCGLGGMFSPGLSLRHPIIMTKTKSQKARAKQSKQIKQETAPKPKTKKSTPWANGGAVIGRALGTLSGIPGAGHSLAGVGRWLGSGIGSIFGSGDYVMAGPQPTYNVLSGQVPKFSTTHATNIVCHREYLGDIKGTSAFNNLTYPLNPGISSTFPWLSTVAANYQQYRFHGLVFEFKSLITDYVTNGAPGVLVLTTNYNADQPAFISRQEAENAEFAASCKPTQDVMHMIECKGDVTAQKLYNVRAGNVAVGQDLRLYDYGLSQIITQNNPAGSVLGELYVSYCVEFFKPVMDIENNVTNAASFHVYRNNATSANPLGFPVAGFSASGGLGAAISSTGTITFSGLTPGVVYRVGLYYIAATTVALTSAGPTSGEPYVTYFNGGTNFGYNVAASTNCVYSVMVRAIAPTMTYSFGATIGSTASLDLFMDTVDPALTA